MSRLAPRVGHESAPSRPSPGAKSTLACSRLSACARVRHARSEGEAPSLVPNKDATKPGPRSLQDVSVENYAPVPACGPLPCPLRWGRSSPGLRGQRHRVPGLRCTCYLLAGLSPMIQLSLRLPRPCVSALRFDPFHCLLPFSTLFHFSLSNGPDLYVRDSAHVHVGDRPLSTEPDRGSGPTRGPRDHDPSWRQTLSP